ncbi:MAG: hypothetical protein JXR88_05515 [Clostridia bacterium]|nr:hypothetical protein [Clostridia bacterium]
MARRKKPLLFRLLSLGLFLVITYIVFNFNGLVKDATIALGLADLNWTVIEAIDIQTDEILGSRPDVMRFNENILVSFNDEISLYNCDGESLGKKAIQSVNSQVLGLEDYVIIIDKQQGNMGVIDYEGNDIAEYGPIGPIKEAIGASANTYIVLTENNYFYVYNYDGVLFFDYALPKGELMGLDVSNDKDYLLLTLLVSSENKFNSRLLTYDIIQNNLVGGNDNVNTVVYGAKLVHQDVVIVDLSGAHAYTKGDPEHLNWTYTREGQLNEFEIDANGNVFEITQLKEVEELIGQSEYHLTSINKDGHEIFNVKLDEPYDTIDILNGKILLKSDKKLSVYNYTGELIASYDNHKKIYSAEWLTNDRIVIVYNDYLEIMELKY